VDWGSSYLPSEINAAYLWSQLEVADDITKSRLALWNRYFQKLSPLADKGVLELPNIPPQCSHNAHMFYLKVEKNKIQADLLAYLRNAGIYAVFHYVPLHSSEAGNKYGEFRGEDIYTTKESSRLIRLPMYYGLSVSDVEIVVDKIREYFT
jgi:dTDP-4-amino-4,6-dideoxygalactose transaminase